MHTTQINSNSPLLNKICSLVADEWHTLTARHTLPPLLCSLPTDHHTLGWVRRKLVCVRAWVCPYYDTSAYLSMCDLTYYMPTLLLVCARVNVCFTCTWLAIYVKWVQMCCWGVSVSVCILPVCSASLAACSVCVCVLGWSYKCRGSKLVYTGEGVRERERNSEKARKTESGGSLGVNGATWLRSVVGQPVVLFPSLSSPLCLSLPFPLFLPLPALHLPTPPRHCAAVKTFNRWWMSQPTPSLPPLPFPSLLEN